MPIRLAGEETVKLVVTSRGPEPESPVDERLGRAYWLLLHDPENGSWVPLDNGVNRNAIKGAGNLTAQTLVDLGIDLVLTGETGPKAFRVLQQAGVAVFHGAFGTALETVRAWREGRLTRARAANEIGSPYCLMADRIGTHRIVG